MVSNATLRRRRHVSCARRGREIFSCELKEATVITKRLPHAANGCWCSGARLVAVAIHAQSPISGALDLRALRKLYNFVGVMLPPVWEIRNTQTWVVDVRIDVATPEDSVRQTKNRCGDVNSNELMKNGRKAQLINRQA
jgi:hypothetical protein